MPSLKGWLMDRLLCIRNAIVSLRLKAFMSFISVVRLGLAGLGTKLRRFPKAIFSLCVNVVLDRLVMNVSNCSANRFIRLDLVILALARQVVEKQFF